ncbi:hypothetical protein Tsubulata_020074 [Turnera subulata]|uniref:DUF4283 domain-containing protein n=1 Tax=Turnera subulata TaxID=218843 RepID=A0A9Q0JNY9_9ROSI|nr:hypothetical protein Tsubulata_020074 [Turnera subulata]
MDSSISLVDSTGLPCSKSAMALDLSRLDSLLGSNPAQLSVSRGKNVAAFVLKQVAPRAPALTREGLSILGSALGKPLHMDQDCTRLLRPDRINLCVEVNFSKPLLHQLNVEFDDESYAILVSYSWKPQQCTLCHSWGHHHLGCATKLKTVKWVPKIVPPNPVLT